MRYGNPQPEAPTHLGSHQLPLPPEWLPPDELDDDDAPTRAARVRAGAWPADVSDSVPTRQPTERSASPILLDRVRPPRTDHGDRPHPADVRREAAHRSRSSHPASPSSDEERRSFVASGEVVTSARIDERKPASRSSRGSSREVGARGSSREVGARGSSREVGARVASRDASSRSPSPRHASAADSSPAHAWEREAASTRGDSQPSVSARGSQPRIDLQAQAAAQAAAEVADQLAQEQQLAQQQAAAMAAMGAIDPLAVPVPPELGGPIYGWVRRLALQADLQGADKVLRDAFLDLTSSLSVAIVYPGEDGLWTLGPDEEIPKEAAPLVAVAQARRAVIASHTALIPVVTTTETVAVVMLARNPRNPAFHPIEQVAMVALARESAAILHHLAVAHLQRADEIKADQGGLYRGEALEAHRTRGNEGVPVNLSPGWVRRTYPILVITILAAVLGAIFITVPTYSTGMGVVVMQATAVTAPTQGTVEQVLVKPGQAVKKDTVLVRLYSAEQDAELRSAQSDADNATIQYLFDQQDEMVKKTLTQALVRVDREKARVETRLVRARTAGTVSDVRVREGMNLMPGEHILQIVDPTAEPEMWAFLPGKDRPRLREGQELQIELVGYTKTREKGVITHVTPEVVGPGEAAKIVGAQLADSIKLAPGSYVWVKAKLPGKSFKTQHRTFWYHHGMPAKTEIKIQDKPFLVTLLPSLEKYLPD